MISNGSRQMSLAEADRIPVRFPGQVEEPRLPLLPVKAVTSKRAITC